MIDVIVSRVFGFITAKDCRVIWADGKLYIAVSPTDIKVVECEAPKKSAGTYKVSSEGGALRFQLPSCGSCRQKVKASAIGQMSIPDIIAAAGALADA